MKTKKNYPILKIGITQYYRMIRCHFSKLVLKKLSEFCELKYEALSHPPYSPDLFLTIFDLFDHLDVFFKDKLFKNQESAGSDFSDFH
uniref:Histone-lysine N-methyltransferase SETMAR n=1 Tax=Strongyloides papillosus TaxID=174720 RepID=A0A0N5CFT0_STREA